MGLLRLSRPRTYAERYLERGLYHLDKKKYEEGIADLSEAIEHDPHNPELYTTRGFIYLEANEAAFLDYAREDFEYALYLNPKEMVAVYCLGMMAYGQGDYEAALTHFARAREIAPLRAEIYYYRALCYYELGNLQRAYDEMDIAKPLFEAGDPRHLAAEKWFNKFKRELKSRSRASKKPKTEQPAAPIPPLTTSRPSVTERLYGQDRAALPGPGGDDSPDEAPPSSASRQPRLPGYRPDALDDAPDPDDEAGDDAYPGY